MHLFEWKIYPQEGGGLRGFRARRVYTVPETACRCAQQVAMFRSDGLHSIDEVDEKTWQEAQPMRDRQAFILRDLLGSGWPVEFRCTGNSLSPFLRPGCVTRWEPVHSTRTLEVGDVVFCAPQPGGRIYHHMIHSIRHEAHPGCCGVVYTFFELSLIHI